jgi:hypothetical protein
MNNTAQQNLSDPPLARQQAAKAQQEALETAFPIGSRVALKFCPDSGEPGEVVGYERGKACVFWPDWNREGRYHMCSLLKVEDRP